MRGERRTSLLLMTTSLVLLGLLAIAGTTAEAECYPYDNSMVVYWPGFGWVCGLSGTYCVECYDLEGGNYCVGDTERTRCGPYHQTP